MTSSRRLYSKPSNLYSEDESSIGSYLSSASSHTASFSIAWENLPKGSIVGGSFDDGIASRKSSRDGRESSKNVRFLSKSTSGEGSGEGDSNALRNDTTMKHFNADMSIGVPYDSLSSNITTPTASNFDRTDYKNEQNDLEMHLNNKSDENMLSEKLEYNAFYSYLEGDMSNCKDSLSKALSIRLRSLGETNFDSANLSEMLTGIKLLPHSAIHFRKALAILNLILIDVKSDKMVCIESKLANVLFELGLDVDDKDALKLYAKLIPIKLESSGIKSYNPNRLVYNLGKLHLKYKNHTKALDCFNQALDSFLFESGQESQKNGELSESEDAFKRLLHHRKSTGYGDFHSVMYRLACVLLNSNKLDEALVLWEKLLIAVDEGKRCGKRDILEKLATVYKKMESYQNAIDTYEKLLEYNDTKFSAELAEKRKSRKAQRGIDRVYCELGKLYQKIGRNFAAIKCYKKAIKIKQMNEKLLDSESHVQMLNGMAMCSFKEGMHDRSLKACFQSLTMSLSEDEELVKERIDTYTLMGTIYRRRSDFVNSKKYYKLANGLQESMLGADKSNVLTTLSNLGIVSYEAGELLDAHVFLDKALDLQVRLSGAGSLEVAKINILIGKVFAKERKYSEALRFYQLAHDTEKRNATDYAVSYTLERIGNVHYKMEQSEQAIVFFEKAFSLKRQCNATLGVLPSNLCEAYISIGNYNKALSYSQVALKVNSEKNGENHECTLKSHDMVARVKMLKGDYKGALLDYEYILNKKRNEMNSDESEAKTLINIGCAYRKIGDYTLAQKNFEDSQNKLTHAFGHDEIKHPAIELVEKYIFELENERTKKMFYFF